MISTRAALGVGAIGLLLMASAGASAQASRDDTVDLELSLEPCVAHLEGRLREIIAIELRTSARVDDHAARAQFYARVRCVNGGVLLEVRSAGEEARAADAVQRLSAAALRGPDPARTLALSIVELLEPALAEAEASADAASDAVASDGAGAGDRESDGLDTDGDGAPLGTLMGRTWGVAAVLGWHPPLGRHAHTGGISLRGLHSVGQRLRVEFGAQLERGGRRVPLGRVAVTGLSVDASALTPIVTSATMVLAVGVGGRLGGVFWRGEPSAEDVIPSRFRAAQVELFARAVADWYFAERWALRSDLELGAALVGSRAAAVENDVSAVVSTSGLRVALALGVVRAF